MRRAHYQALLDWKASSPRKPLILRGARQVGKTTLLKAFAQQEYTSYLYLNFEDTPALKDLFMESLDPHHIIQVLSLAFNQHIAPDNTLLIFDEVQESPEALNSLKYFCEEAPQYSICAAGSLLGVKLTHTKGFPVGRVYFADLYPMSFLEFLHAINEPALKHYLDEINVIKPLPKLLHDKLIHLLKQYLLVGGMPEVVASYVKDRDFNQIRKIQSDILDAYSVDFAKHAPKNDIMKISEVWQCIPTQLAKENKKFVYSKIRKSARGREYDHAIQWLVDAGLIYKVFNASAPQLPLSAYTDPNAFKIYILDVGLLGAMADITPKILIEGHALFLHFNGAFIENFVAQALKMNIKQLHYWSSQGSAELDYLIQYEDQIIPVEVKSGLSRQKKSLKFYQEKFKPTLSIVASPANLVLDGRIMNCPLYMANYLMGNLINLVK